MGSWFHWVLGGVLCILVVSTAGCVSEETAEKLAQARREYAEAKTKVESLRAQMEQLKADFKSGKLKANDLMAQLAILGTELKLGMQEMAEAGQAAKTYATAPEPWWDKVGFFLLTLLGVATGRKIGIPGLASGTKPVGFLQPRDS